MQPPRQLVWDAIQAIRPSFLSRNPTFNFITAHYFWVIGWSLLGSVIVFGANRGQFSYIDCLFHTTGANTQAGLNTVDINLFSTFSQVVFYLLTMMSNPITLHSSVVFLRLYWFEKRFQHIAKDAKTRRVTMAQSRTKAKSTPPDPEKGVNGRKIEVMRNTGKPSRVNNDGTLPESTMGDDQIPPDELPSSSSSSGHPQRPAPPQIKFSDQVTRSDAIQGDDDDDDTPLPRQRSDAEHIAILERQRKADKSVLRIPGPRDVERGVRPEEVDDDEEDNVPGSPEGTRKVSRLEPSRTVSNTAHRPMPSGDRTIAFAEPVRPKNDEGKAEQPEDDDEAAAEAAGAFSPLRNRFHKFGDRMHRSETRASSIIRRSTNPLARIKTALSHNPAEEMPYLSWEPTMGRNSQFLGMSEEQREELGGIEYRSLKTLAIFLTSYFWGYTVFAVICIVPWILNDNGLYSSVVDKAGINRVWWAFFTANSSFMDLGFTLTPDSMISFQSAIWLLGIMSFLIIIGNTGFPVMLRFMIWVTSLWVPQGSGVYEELRFLLDHPRRCFTLMFPSNANWWLVLMLILLNGIDLLFFMVLDLGDESVTSLPLNIRFLTGWFQAVSTRTAGFSSISLSVLHPAVQVSYMIMMYISIYPIAISVRRTNVYEQKSLGVYNESNIDDMSQGTFSYVGAHLRRQLSFDLWYIAVGLFILAISEGPRIASNDISLFAILFELISAYGTVGMSLGYTTVNASLSSQFTTVGKLVIIAAMIRGRHRGLPYGLDRAVLLPSEHLDRAEAEDNELVLQRRESALSTAVSMGRPASILTARTGRTVRPQSRSVDRRNVFTNLLHPGPIFDHPASPGRSEFGREETLPRFENGMFDNTSDPKFNSPASPGHRRTESATSNAPWSRGASPSANRANV